MHHEDKKQETAEIVTAEDTVFVKVPAGKKYLGLDQQEQSKQKDLTCWYYSFNLLRPRLGKKVDALAAQAANSDLKADAELRHLKELRAIEISISKYRKKSPEHAQWRDRALLIYQSLVNKLGGDFSPEKLEIYLNQLKAHLKSKEFVAEKGNKILETIQLIQSYLDSERSFDLEVFIQREYIKKEINSAHQLLKKLGKLNSVEQFKKFHDNMDHLSLIELKFLQGIYHTALVNASAKSYQLQPSAFDPKNGFQGLKDAIKKEGAISFGNYVGTPYYTEPAIRGGKSKADKRIESQSQYEIYSWRAGVKRYGLLETNMWHHIVVVGVQTISLRGGKTQDTVLFLDPNDKSLPNQPRKLYRISFDTFLKTLNNIHGESYFYRKAEGPFGYSANPALKQQLQTEFQHVTEKASSFRAA